MDDKNYLKALDLIEELANISREKLDLAMDEIKELRIAVITLGVSVLLLVLTVCHLWGK